MQELGARLLYRQQNLHARLPSQRQTFPRDLLDVTTKLLVHTLAQSALHDAGYSLLQSSVGSSQHASVT
eukprot:COSAG04_NODE_194_length_20815_cov_4.321591_2_plen_69_part_00